MKIAIINAIRQLSLGGLICLFFAVSASYAAPVVYKNTASESHLLDASVYQFTAALGGTAHGDGGSYQTGYRYISWDEIPVGAANNTLPPNYYNTVAPRGVRLSSDCSNDVFRLSNPANGQPLHFGEINPNYATDFKHYFGERLVSISAGACNVIDITFYIPGTRVPATVSGFGAVFADVDTNQSTGIIYYGVDGEQLAGEQTAITSNNGLSLLGVKFTEGERVARVRIFLGTATLGETDKSRGGERDVVVMDSVFYGEPRAIGHQQSDFDGDGTSDYSVFRPSNGTWYVINSGSNTFSGTQFGASGDLPVDGDFDGDSRNDLAVFRPSNGGWYILRSSDGQFQGTAFGQAGDKPAVGDYDKDGKSDIAVWRPATGTYYYLKSSNGQFQSAQFGANGDIPIGAGAP